MVDKTTSSCHRGAGIERSCLTANLVILARHIDGFYSQLPAHVASHHKMRHVPSECEETPCLDGPAAAQLHPRHHQVVEGRRCASAGPLLRDTGAA